MRMSYEDLRDFIARKMRLTTHAYQPLVIKALVDAENGASIRDLALGLLSRDESGIQYYEKKIKEMPVKVLSKHGVVVRSGDMISLNVDALTLAQRADIRSLCEEKFQDQVAKRGMSIWDYRLVDTDRHFGYLRYRVLKESGGRCALCGISKEDSPLDIDHIIPRSKGGKTVYENLQVLCANCNRSKANKDETDFRQDTCETKEGCPFCGASETREVLLENEYGLALLDRYPVSAGHTLIVPRRHVEDYFRLSVAEQMGIDELLLIRRNQLMQEDSTIVGFNVGVNCGRAAGQTIDHCHVHLIARRHGDTPRPEGGVRGVIPDRMGYGHLA